MAGMDYPDAMLHLRTTDVWRDIPKALNTTTAFSRSMDKSGLPVELLKHKQIFRPARDSAKLTIKIHIPTTEDTESSLRYTGQMLLANHFEYYFGTMNLDILRDEDGKRYAIPDFTWRDGQKKTRFVQVKTESKSDSLIYTITLKFFPPQL